MNKENWKIIKERALKDLNAMQDWEKKQKRKVSQILKKQKIELTLENIPKIVKLFEHKKITSLYPNEYTHCQSPCHNLSNLNCFLCDCPNYDNKYIYESPKEKILIGRCTKKGNGNYSFYKGFPIGIWDCSNCNINHTPKEVENYLKEKLKKEKKQSKMESIISKT